MVLGHLPMWAGSLPTWALLAVALVAVWRLGRAGVARGSGEAIDLQGKTIAVLQENLQKTQEQNAALTADNQRLVETRDLPEVLHRVVDQFDRHELRAEQRHAQLMEEVKYARTFRAGDGEGGPPGGQ